MGIYKRHVRICDKYQNLRYWHIISCTKITWVLVKTHIPNWNNYLISIFFAADFFVDSFFTLFVITIMFSLCPAFSIPRDCVYKLVCTFSSWAWHKNIWSAHEKTVLIAAYAWMRSLKVHTQFPHGAWCLVNLLRTFIYYYALRFRAVDALARLHRWGESSEHSLFALNPMSWAFCFLWSARLI